MKKPLPAKSFSDLRKERDIAQLQQTIRSLRAELHMERSRRQLAEAQVEYLSRNVDDLKTDVAYWKMSHDELLDINESMQRSLYIYEEHAGSEEEVRIDMAIAGTIFEKPFEHWPSLAHKVPQATYQRHYDVANVLWTVLVRGEG